MQSSHLQDSKETTGGSPAAFHTSGNEATPSLLIESSQLSPSLPTRKPLEPTAEELAALSRFERFAFRFTHQIGRAHVELQSLRHLVCRLLLEKENRHGAR